MAKKFNCSRKFLTGPWLASLLGCVAFLLVCIPARPDNPPADTVGPIEGEAIAVQGPMDIEVVHGQVTTVLRSGSDVRVKSGQARITLANNGQITICGPAHFSVLKSGNSLTIALDSGTIHVHIERGLALTVYTPQIQAKPLSIGDGPQDALVGIDAQGAMCVRANIGAVRIEQQLVTQNILVPQGSDIVLSSGVASAAGQSTQVGPLDGLRNTAGHCTCDLQLANAMPPPVEVSRLATPQEIQQQEAAVAKTPPPAPAPKAAAKDEPVYQVFMPPLSYDAKAKVQPDNFDPSLIVLVRRVRVRPTLIFEGRVEGDAPHPVASAPSSSAQASSPAPPSATAKPSPAPKTPPQSTDSVTNRVRTLWHRIFS